MAKKYYHKPIYGVAVNGEVLMIHMMHEEAQWISWNIEGAYIVRTLKIVENCSECKLWIDSRR